jgi:hypothetical protein
MPYRPAVTSNLAVQLHMLASYECPNLDKTSTQQRTEVDASYALS